jgi:hypothetical protein
MEESVIYQKIIRKGEAKGFHNARETLLEIGTKQLGAPNKVQRKRIEQCDDLDRLSRMTIVAVDAPDWAAVLATR